MATERHWWDALYGVVFKQNTTEHPQRPVVLFKGPGATIVDNPVTQETEITIDGAAAEVADDIDKTGSVIDRVRGIQGRPVDSGAPARGDSLVWDTIGAKYVAGRPLPEGMFDPRRFGAKLDGVTDDLAAFDAMIAAMPSTGGGVWLPGGAAVWISDTWKVTRPIYFAGLGGTGLGHSFFEVAPGRAAIFFDENDVALINGSSRCVVDRLEVRTRALIHPTVNGNTFGRAVRVWSSTGQARKGEVFVASAGASPTRCFRVTDTGHGNSPGSFGVSEPAWNTTLGATTTTNGLSLVCESLMAVHQTSHAYAVGDRVWAPNDHRFVFECEVAGTSAASRPNELKGDDLIVGVQVHGTVTDGGVTWRVKLSCGVYINSDLGKFGVIHASNFVGAAVHLQGGTGQDARFMTYADNVRVREVISEYCGLGVFVGGSDANGWTIGGLFVINAGTLLPTPADAYGANGLGGHALVDRSDAGGRVSDLYAQTSTGRPVLKTGNGRALIESSFTELYRLALASGGYTLAIGGTLGEYSAWEAASNVTCVSASGSRQIFSVDPQSANTIRAYLDLQDGYTVHAVSSDDEHANVLGLKYRYNLVPRGYWAFTFGNQNAKIAYCVTGAYASPAPGPGWFTLPDGLLIGDPSGTELYEGDVAMLRSLKLRGGARKKGDRFRHSEQIVTLTSDGFRAPAWQASHAYEVAYPNWGIPADMIEPTSNTGTRLGGERVWRLTSAGTSGGGEPSWPASPANGQTVSDGSCVWTYYTGQITPTWEETGPAGTTATSVAATGLERRKIYSDLAYVVTTDATATTVFSWTIPDEAVSTVVVEIDAIKRDGSLTASYVRRARIKRDGGTVSMGTPEETFTDEEAGFAACDVTIDNSGATGRVRVTGIAATTIDWSCTVTRTEATHA